MSFLKQLISQNTTDIQNIGARQLAKGMRSAQKKEESLGSAKGFLDTFASLVDPTGGIASSIFQTGSDSILRAFGMGARESDIREHVDKKYRKFGVGKALKTAEEGLLDARSASKQRGVSNALLSFLGSKAGENIIDNIKSNTFGDLFRSKDFKDAQKKAIDSGTTSPLFDYLEKDQFPVGEEFLSNPEFIYLQPEMPSFPGSKELDTLNSTVFPWENGGMVQKYENGGIIDENNILRGTGQKKYVKINQRQNKYQKEGFVSPLTQNIYDLQEYTWDGKEWIKGEITKPSHSEQRKNKGFVHIGDFHRQAGATSKDLLDSEEDLSKFRTSDLTEGVTSKYMEGEGTATGGVGLTEFSRDPETAALINSAKSGDQNALKTLAEIARQTRPQLANATDDQIIGEISENLTSIDLQGQGFQDLTRQKETALRGAQETYDTGLQKVDTLATKLAGMSSPQGMGSSQRTMRKGMGTVSEELSDLFGERKSKVSDIEEAYKSDYQTELEDQFDPFASIVMGLTLPSEE